MAKSAIGSLYVSLTANTEKFQKGFRKAARRVQRFRKDFNRQAQRVAKIGGAMFAGAAVGVSYYVKRSMAAIDATAKLADRVGASVDGMRGLQHAAELTGTSTATMGKSLEKMRKNLGDASMGTGEAKRYLDSMGLSAETLAGMRAEDSFAAIADGIKGLANESERAAAAQALFGRSGVQMLNMLNQGGDSIRRMTADAVRLRGSLSRLDASQVEKANDAISNMGVALSGVWDKLAVAVSPAVTAFANHAAEAFVTLRQRVAVEINNVIKAVLALDNSGAIGKFVGQVKAGIAGLLALAQTAVGALSAVKRGIERALNPKKAAQYDMAKDALAKRKMALRGLEGGIADEEAWLARNANSRPEEAKQARAHRDKLKRMAEITRDEMKNLQRTMATLGGYDMESAFEGIAGAWKQALDRSMGATAHSVIPQGVKDTLAQMASGAGGAGAQAGDAYIDQFAASVLGKWRGLVDKLTATGPQSLLPAQARFAGAAMRGSQEAYRASLPSEVAGKGVEKAQKDTAKNTRETVSKLDGVIAAIHATGLGDTIVAAPI